MKTPENSKTNLDDLIQKIKSEGIEEAERKSEEIIKAARLTASKILNKANLNHTDELPTIEYPLRCQLTVTLASDNN